MKRSLVTGLAVSICAATWSAAAAGGCFCDSAAVPPEAIVADAMSLGFAPITPPFRRGPYDVLHALDPNGVRVRILADAQFGDILSIDEIFIPSYDAGPRVIRVSSNNAERRRIHYENGGLPIRIIRLDPK